MSPLSLLQLSLARLPGHSVSRHALVAAPLVVAGLVVAGCVAFDLTETAPPGPGTGETGSGSQPSPEAVAQAPNEARPAYPDLPTNAPPQPDQPYPGYRRPTRPRPEPPTPKPTAEYKLDDLPAGAVTRLSRISSFIGATVDEGYLQTIPYVVYDSGKVQTHGIALVHRVEGKPAKLLWDTSRYDDAPTPIIDVKSLYDRLLLVGTDDVALVELDVDPEGVSVSRDYSLGIVGESAESIGVEVVAIDIDADGTYEHVVAVHVSSAEPVQYVVFEEEMPPRMREVARLEPHAQIMDIDLDGVAELLEPRDDGGWNVQLYDGFSLSDADPIEAEPAVPAPVATDGELPALPADLYFHRDGGVYRWPRPGGSIETVWSEPPPPETSSGSGSAEWSVMDPTSRDDWRSRKVLDVADDGSVAVLVEQSVGAENDVSHRFRVIDTRTGASRSVPIRGLLREYGLPMLWGITADGRRLVYAGYGATDESHHSEGPGDIPEAATNEVQLFRDWRARGGAIDAIDLEGVLETHGAGELTSQQVAICSLIDLTDTGEHGAYGCSGLSLSTDDNRLAYSDGRGLWVVDLPDGEPVLVLEHHFGEREADIRVYDPNAWSPDGSRILLTVSYYESRDFVILDLATGEVQLIAGFIEPGGPRRDITWLPDSTAVANARPNVSEPLAPALSLVDASDASRVTNLLPQALYVPDGGYHPVSPHVSTDGTVRYAMRHFRDDLYWASGIFTSSLEGSAWSRLAGLPLVRPERTYHHDVDPGDVIWSPYGNAFVATESVRDWYPVDNAAVLGITSDGETRTWDVSDVLHGAWSLHWVE